MMVPLAGFEPATFSLPWNCSTVGAKAALEKLHHFTTQFFFQQLKFKSLLVYHRLSRLGRGDFMLQYTHKGRVYYARKQPG